MHILTLPTVMALTLLLRPGLGDTQEPNRNPAPLKASSGAYSADLLQEYRRVPQKPFEWWGGDRDPKLRTVRLLRAMKGKKDVVIPISAYADLSEVRSLAVHATRGGCKIVIVGGQTASRYTAEISIEGVRTKTRTVRLEEFKHDSWEKTVYSYPPDNI